MCREDAAPVKLSPVARRAMQNAEVMLADARRLVEGDGLADSFADVAEAWQAIVTARAKVRAVLNTR